MNSYEANYKKQFDGVNPFTHKKILITAREKLADLINGAWKYSWHWPVDHNEWLDSAKLSLESEKETVMKRFEQLKYAEQILSSIEKNDEEPGHD